MYGDDKIETIDQLKTYLADQRGLVALDYDHLTTAEFRQEVATQLNAFIEYVVDAEGSAQRNIMDSTPSAWWKSIGTEKFPILYNLAIRVYSIPTSSAASERIWSTYDFVHSKRRNRLGAKKSSDLVYVYANAAIEARENKDADYAKLIMNMVNQDEDSSSDED